MRKKSFFQKFLPSAIRTHPKMKNGMALFVLSAPTIKKLMDAREHLRYWPYVKAFYPVDSTHIRVWVYVAKSRQGAMWSYYVTRSSELMNLCVRQYQASFMLVCTSPSTQFRRYHPNGFMRPDDLLKPFSDFINELEMC